MKPQLQALRATVSKLNTANPLNAAGLAKQASRETMALLEAIDERLAALEASQASLLKASQGRPHG